MIVDYDAIKAAITAWVDEAAGEYLYTQEDGDAAIWWAEEAHNYQVSPYVELTWNDGGQQGQDARTWQSIDGDEDTLTPRIVGNRQVVVTVEVRSRGDVNVPRQVCEALRMSFENDLMMTALRQASGIAPVRVEAVPVIAGVPWEGRIEPVGTMDLRFSYTAIYENANQTVERVRNVGMRNQIRDNAGNLVGSNIEFLVGLDYPPGDEMPILASPFSRGFDASAFGSGVSSSGAGFSSGFDADAFG